MDVWTNDLAGGILFQEDPYPINAHGYQDRVQAQERFVNMTYRSPTAMASPSERLMMHQPRPGLMRGLSLGELRVQQQHQQQSHHPVGGVLRLPADFDTSKVATHGTLKRLNKLVKSPTDTQLIVPNLQQHLPHPHQLHQQQQSHHHQAHLQQQQQHHVQPPQQMMLPNMVPDPNNGKFRCFKE